MMEGDSHQSSMRSGGRRQPTFGGVPVALGLPGDDPAAVDSRRLVVGIMGAGEGARAEDLALAERLGELVARQGWVVLTGGRAVGVMDAASRGAKGVDGSLTVGVLPSGVGGVSRHVDLALFTGMGDARNAINVLSSDVVVTCGAGGPGTASEAALALKAGRPLVLLGPTAEAAAFFAALDPTVEVAQTPEEVVALVRRRAG
jgi:uncharacterized protein (TIGR00725 family)